MTNTEAIAKAREHLAAAASSRKDAAQEGHLRRAVEHLLTVVEVLEKRAADVTASGWRA